MKFRTFKKWFRKNWSSSFSIIIEISLLIIFQFSYKHNYISKQNIDNAMDLIVLLSSIIAGIVIAFITSKIIQIRQEKIALKPSIWDLTKKLHYFRKIIHEFVNNYDFWPNGLPNYIKQTYPALSYYDVRDIIYVNKQTKEEASKFIQDEKYGEIKKQAFLEMKSFLLPIKVCDETVYSEFDVELMYSTNTLDKWQEYDCGSMIWNLFDDKYMLYEGQFDFNSFQVSKQKEIDLLAKKIDIERYKNIEFGPNLLGKLGSQIDLDIIPKLNRLQHEFEKGIPVILRFMYFVLSSILIFGVVLPIILKLFDFPVIISFISITTVLSLTIFLVLRLPYVMKREIYVV